MTKFNLDFVIVDLEELREKVRDEEILAYYVGEFELGVKYKSPFPGREDSTPSFMITYYKEKLVWRDFGISPRPGDALDFVQRYLGLNLRDTIQRIWLDLIVNKGKTEELLNFSANIEENKGITTLPLTSKVRFRKFYTPQELAYWADYYITQEELLKYRIYPGELHYNNKLFHRSTAKDPLFIYMYKQETLSWKSYRPLAADKKNKFRNNNCSDVIQGFEFLPMIGENLIYTSSYKDVITLTKAGFNAVAPQSENVFINKFAYMDLKNRFSNHYTLYDNDDTGYKRSKLVEKEFGTTPLILPEVLSSIDNTTILKDPSDISKDKSLESVQKIVTNLLGKDNIPF